jgi:hypothetical protein
MRRHRRGLPLQPTGRRGRGQAQSFQGSSLSQNSRGESSVGTAKPLRVDFLRWRSARPSQGRALARQAALRGKRVAGLAPGGIRGLQRRECGLDGWGTDHR